MSNLFDICREYNRKRLNEFSEKMAEIISKELPEGIEIEIEKYKKKEELIRYREPKADPFWGANDTYFLCPGDIDSEEVIEGCVEVVNDD